jgi:hypothetical protein
MIRIDKLGGLPTTPEDYIEELVTERIEDIQSLPSHVLAVLTDRSGTVVDVGPGEGISSMALANIVPSSQVIGVEMDKDHLRAAWPKCRDYANLDLCWGVLPGTPSNGLVKEGLPLAPTASLSPERCSVLFSWIGMSRRDVFEAHGEWNPIVGNACVLILPRFWREGLESLPVNDRRALEELLKQVGVTPPIWPEYAGIESFANVTCHSLAKAVKARGWVLWLSGVFDNLDVSLWDTLLDRWEQRPKYQLPDIRFELEAIVARRR